MIAWVCERGCVDTRIHTHLSQKGRAQRCVKRGSQRVCERVCERVCGEENPYSFVSEGRGAQRVCERVCGEGETGGPILTDQSIDGRNSAVASHPTECEVKYT